MRPMNSFLATSPRRWRLLLRSKRRCYIRYILKEGIRSRAHHFRYSSPVGRRGGQEHMCHTVHVLHRHAQQGAQRTTIGFTNASGHDDHKKQGSVTNGNDTIPPTMAPVAAARNWDYRGMAARGGNLQRRHIPGQKHSQCGRPRSRACAAFQCAAKRSLCA